MRPYAVSPVACFCVVTSNAIRVQLPGGPLYAPAFSQAAESTGARSGLPAKTARTYTELVDLAVAALNSGGASMITLEMVVHDDSLSAKLTGKGCKSPTKKLIKALEAAAAKKANSLSHKTTKSALIIGFET